jgi:hypothetical protein
MRALLPLKRGGGNIAMLAHPEWVARALVSIFLGLHGFENRQDRRVHAELHPHRKIERRFP